MSKLLRVVCGISGGVDSAVAALLLKRKGYDVVGLFMRNWDIPDETGQCCADGDFEDAVHVCEHLNIPLHEVSFVKEYWNHVFSEMLKDYQQGITPNPDILCNKYIKFDAFMKHALEQLEGHLIATGHYARSTMKGHCNTLFPLGDLTKTVVKQLAMEAGLEKIVMKKESMGICFIGSRRFHKFIEEYVEPRPGNFIDIDTQKIVGTHKGVHYWTLGQRALIPGQKDAYFIVNKDASTRDILVAQGTDHPALFVQMFVTESPYWIHGPPPHLMQGQSVQVDFRFQHKHPLLPCTVCKSEGNGLEVTLPSPLRSITPGQYAVFYQGDECLGSSRIIWTGPSLHALKHIGRVNIPAAFH
ncbi:hypothetical protein C0Q70_15324 [Pomacea canaliculata]|uniref:tRNA-5-taurinomethyluridine 2-sulfurtransferase n=1 Tax=Pomacea canaliculata TaxID=400727 RepID=A0A2T7NUH3_POMCA|nr:hypothetical protein C0Q70_15324 [Pomacea canaliculata]